MAELLDVTAFETIIPSRFVTFTIPYPSLSASHRLIRIAVYDSPFQLVGSPARAAVMFVPEQREYDWVFSTESGHLQLLLNLQGISRLLLIGDEPVNGVDSPTVYRRTVKSCDRERLEQSLIPLVTVLSPKVFSENGNPQIPIVSYDDNVICSVVLGKCKGSFVGEMLVEEIEIQSNSKTGNCQGTREFRGD
ncbi:uncharacterized protein LOC110809163 [Carica papaya]|uniref:uncharacterized protein LOC110809163 n=1 Tax=Carica papaya TaxID=3649 RepID=UPI000B8C7AEA|nr:uncharacterized protein LOC110809163 [Carica papaya]